MLKIKMSEFRLSEFTILFIKGTEVHIFCYTDVYKFIFRNLARQKLKDNKRNYRKSKESRSKTSIFTNVS